MWWIDKRTNGRGSATITQRCCLSRGATRAVASPPNRSASTASDSTRRDQHQERHLACDLAGANRELQETSADNFLDRQRLLDDIRALERLIRETKVTRRVLEAKLDQVNHDRDQLRSQVRFLSHRVTAQARANHHLARQHPTVPTTADNRLADTGAAKLDNAA